MHNLDPGPIYNEITELGKTSPVKINSMFVKFSKSKPTNFIDDHVKLNSNPGVGRYETQRKNKIIGNYKYQSPKSAFFDEATAKGFDSPSHYPNVNVEKYKMGRTQDCKIWKPLKEAPNRIIKDNTVSPHTYKTEGKHANMSTFKRV